MVSAGLRTQWPQECAAIGWPLSGRSAPWRARRRLSGPRLLIFSQHACIMVFKRAPVCSAMHFGTRGGVIGVGHKAVYLTDSTEAKLVFKYTVSLYKMVAFQLFN